MGTRSLTLVRDENGSVLINMYRQYDGYPSGHGQELFEFLAPFTIVNGLGSGMKTPVANGMGCLAAQLVKHFKDDAGGIYLYPPAARDCGEEFIYTVYLSKKHHGEGTLMLKIQSGVATYFGASGTKDEDMRVLWDAPVSEWDLDKIRT